MFRNKIGWRAKQIQENIMNQRGDSKKNVLKKG